MCTARGAWSTMWCTSSGTIPPLTTSMVSAMILRDLVLEREGQLIGHVLYMRAQLHTVDGRILPVMTFGPISIHPDFQGQGYGAQLLEASMEWAKQMGAGALCIEGNPAYYGRFGFAAASAQGIRCQGTPAEDPAPYFLCKELVEGYLEGCAGVYHTPKGYFVEEEAVERFDQAFPPKKKETLPGQLF